MALEVLALVELLDAFFAAVAFLAAVFFTAGFAAAFLATGFFLASAIIFSFRFQMRVSSNNTLRQNPLPAWASHGARCEADYSSAYADPACLR